MLGTTTPPEGGSNQMPSLERTTVADAMHSGILTCEPDTTLKKVARLMATNRVHCLAVVGVSHTDPVCGMWGIVSDLDLVRVAIRGDLEASAGSLAMSPLVSVTSSTPLREAGDLMVINHVSHLVVIEPETQRPIGILSTLDIAGVMGRNEG
jgi:CBS domain-containing protein